MDDVRRSSSAAATASCSTATCGATSRISRSDMMIKRAASHHAAMEAAALIEEQVANVFLEERWRLLHFISAAARITSLIIPLLLHSTRQRLLQP